MYINLIPKEWDLGQGTYPEKWLFEVAGDALVIRAEPLGLFYDEYPLTLCAPLFDSYSMTPISLLERVQGMQTFGDWLINSLIWKTRKAMGINIVYDPEAVNEWDLTAEGPVKLIRLNPTHWGRGEVSKYVHQLDINEDSGTHLQNFTFLMDIYPRVTGANDGMQGIMKSTGERRSATEARDSFQSAVSRVQKSAKIISLQTHQDIARMFAYNVQQLMSSEQRLRITGDWEERLQQEYGKDITEGKGALTASPDDFLDFDYDIISHDAALPGEEDRESWTQMLQPMLSNPTGFQQLGLDGRRIFLHVARQLGARDAADFILRPPKTRTMDNEQVLREEERGNIVPIEPAGAIGGNGGSPIF
jgi:hypothetical protein